MNIMIDNIEYKINNFDMNLLNNKANKICIIGMTNTGKTTLILNIVNKLKDIKYGSIITPTDRRNKTYESQFKDGYIEYEYNSEILKKVLLRQKKLKEPNFLFIMDNCDCAKIKWTNDKNYDKIMKKDFNITFIQTMQYSMGILHREYFDYIFITEADLMLNRKKIYEHYFSNIYETFNIFDKIYKKIMKDYRCIIVDTKNKLVYIYDIVKKNNIIENINMINIMEYGKVINILI
jgi:GTPase SAR1 family protein